jgi:hypothetical protein
MNLPADPRSKLPIFGGIWITLAPLLFLMAAISTVESMTTYYVQLAAFSTVALVGFVAGCWRLLLRVGSDTFTLAIPPVDRGKV